MLLEAVAKRRINLRQKKDHFSSVTYAAEVVKINLNWVALKKIGQGCCQKKGKLRVCVELRVDTVLTMSMK